ncbi:UMP-CMP kinase 2, mitochondrial-like isoform X2 [Tubulanus polymorphus]
MHGFQTQTIRMFMTLQRVLLNHGRCNLAIIAINSRLQKNRSPLNFRLRGINMATTNTEIIDFDDFVFSHSTETTGVVKHWKICEKPQNSKTKNLFGADEEIILFLSAFRRENTNVENVIATRDLETKIQRQQISCARSSRSCEKSFATNRKNTDGNLLNFLEGIVVGVAETDDNVITDDVSIWMKIKRDANSPEAGFAVVESYSKNFLSGKYCVPVNDAAEVPTYNPIFDFSYANAIYHSYSEALDILEKCKDRPEVAELLRICEERSAMTFEANKLQSEMKHPFIVIEGLDASGKSTLTEYLANLLKANKMQTPAVYMHHVRKQFDALPEIVRRAYYAISNYIVAKDIVDTCKTTPVIMDRFWHSTTAYAITNDCAIGGAAFIPPAGHAIYRWPSDLIKPHAVVLLTVTEETRESRINERRLEKTWEENKLGASRLFRQRLVAAYRRMENPHCIEIDANQTREAVARDTVNQLKRLNIL